MTDSEYEQYQIWLEGDFMGRLGKFSDELAKRVERAEREMNSDTNTGSRFYMERVMEYTAFKEADNLLREIFPEAGEYKPREVSA